MGWLGGRLRGLWAPLAVLEGLCSIRRRWWPGCGSGRRSARRCWRRSRRRRPPAGPRSPAGAWSARGRSRGCGRRGSSHDGVGPRPRTPARPAQGRCTRTTMRGCGGRWRAMSATRRPGRRAIRPAGWTRCCTWGRWPAPASCRAVRGRCATPSARWISSRGGCERSPRPTAPSIASGPLGGRASSREQAGAAVQLPGGVAAVACARRARPADVRPARAAALDPDARFVPPAGSDAYRMVVRDAYLLAGRLLPVDVDGRKQMACATSASCRPLSAGCGSPTSSGSWPSSRI